MEDTACAERNGETDELRLTGLEEIPLACPTTEQEVEGVSKVELKPVAIVGDEVVVDRVVVVPVSCE